MGKAAHRSLIIMGMVLTLSKAVLAASPELLLFGGDNHTKFLGCITCGELEPNSIWNEMSTYGWQNGFGVWNPVWRI